MTVGKIEQLTITGVTVNNTEITRLRAQLAAYEKALQAWDELVNEDGRWIGTIGYAMNARRLTAEARANGRSVK